MPAHLRKSSNDQLSGQKARLQEHAPDVQAEQTRAPEGYDLLAIGISKGDGQGAGAHAAALNRATASQPTRAGHSLLQLQRQYGNRYVQRVLGLARQREGEADTSRDLKQAIQQARGGGQALDSGTRAGMESSFGADFSGVRVHADAGADALNRSLNARAFTTGQDIFFKQGEYTPGSSGGRELLAHELTHVVQQNGDQVRRKLTVGQPSDGSRAPLTYAEQAKASGVCSLMTDLTGRVGAVSSTRRHAETLQCASVLHPTNPGLKAHNSSGTRNINVQRRIMIAGPRRLYRVKLRRNWNILISQLRAEFLERHRRRFRIGGRSRYGLAKRIVEDMADTTEELKFEDERELLKEIKKRLWTSYLMGKSQRGRRVRGRLRYAFGYPERGRAKHCDRRVNAAAKKYWKGPIGSKSDYRFELSEKWGKNNAYKAIKRLFVRQRNPCKRTLIHCDNLISLVHFLAFAESMGRKTFNQRVRDGTIQVSLHHSGFQYIEKSPGRPREAVSLRKVALARREDLIIGDHVMFFNHPAYDVLIQGVGGVWRLENAVLVDQRAGVDRFQGHGYRTPVTETDMKRSMRRHIARHVDTVTRLIRQLRSRSSRTRSRARAELSRYVGVRRVGSEYRIKGTAFRKTYRIPVNLPLEVPDELPGLENPKSGRIEPVWRPVESE